MCQVIPRCPCGLTTLFDRLYLSSQTEMPDVTLLTVLSVFLIDTYLGAREHLGCMFACFLVWILTNVTCKEQGPRQSLHAWDIKGYKSTHVVSVYGGKEGGSVPLDFLFVLPRTTLVWLPRNRKATQKSLICHSDIVFWEQSVTRLQFFKSQLSIC